MEQILVLQKILKKEGVYGSVIDGVWGPLSQKGLEDLVGSGKYSLDFNFNVFREAFKLNKITQDMVDNINTIFKAIFKWKAYNPLIIAYMLATTWHETGFTLRPVKEAGSYKYLSKYDTGVLAKALGNTPQADGDGVLYAGRGYVQITGKANYKKFSDILGIDLIKNPDYTLQPEIAADILVYGSLKGSFTGKKLSDYIKKGTRAEFIEARRVINGTDKAMSIARYAEKFLQCIVLTPTQK